MAAKVRDSLPGFRAERGEISFRTPRNVFRRWFRRARGNLILFLWRKN